MKAIQSELGEGNELAEEIAQFREKIEAAKMPKPAEEESLRQLKKLERMHPDAAETATLRNWMEIMTDLPWSRSSVDNLDLQKAEQVLNDDHYGLEKVKDRIIEALAVRKLKEKPKGPILCLVGPPGVGKTSLGRSIARALDRLEAFTMKPRFAVIVVLMSARCPVASSRACSRRARTIR
jgi:ATP-dependent Lon protease